MPLKIRQRRASAVRRVIKSQAGEAPRQSARWRTARAGVQTARHGGYLVLFSSGLSVNVIAKPVRVAPIPKPIVHVPTNISVTASGARL